MADTNENYTAMAIQRITYKYRLYPSRAQVEALTFQLSEACHLYNAALQERRDAWRVGQKSIHYFDQSSQLKEIRAAGDLSLANFSACQDVLRRVDKTFKAFFRRMKRKEKAGFPRFKSHTRFDSYTFPAYGDGCKLIDSKLRLQGVGLVKVKLHRAVEGKIKTVTIKRECNKWYVCISVERESKPLPICTETVGIDVGLSSFATLNDGTEIDNPRYYREAQKALRLSQRRVARRKKGSHRRHKAVRLLQRAHAYVRNQRANFHHEISRWLVSNYGLIAVEDLNIKGMVKNRRLSKSISDAGWSAFMDKIAYKAESAGRDFVKVNPRGTSQTCTCGASVPKTLSQRWHHCLSCGLSLARDHVSAQIILARGLRVQASTCPVRECVA